MAREGLSPQIHEMPTLFTNVQPRNPLIDKFKIVKASVWCLVLNLYF